jgi:hypothetical protein
MFDGEEVEERNSDGELIYMHRESWDEVTEAVAKGILGK